MAKGRQTDSFSAGRIVLGKQVRYLYRTVSCGKPGCRTCPHGPYLYCRSWVQTDNGVRRVELYVGKRGSDAEQRVLHEHLAREAEIERVNLELAGNFRHEAAAIISEIGKENFPARGPIGSLATGERMARVLGVIARVASKS